MICRLSLSIALLCLLMPSITMAKESLFLLTSNAAVHRKYETSRERMKRRKFKKRQLYHDGGKNQIGFEVAIGELENFLYSNKTNQKEDTLSFFLSYIRFFIPKTSWGRLGLGLRVGVIGKDDFPNSYPSFVTLGPRLSYMAHISSGQFFVPNLELAYERVLNRVKDSTIKENFSGIVWGLGFFVNLNRLDPDTALRSVRTTGVRKFNLSFMYHNRNGALTAYKSNSFTAGIRFEY